ncbi:hypothetical protein BYT27DRAFT_6682806 [Phlegmacium glaucopus]|nr:hypothetical protein BYT27DRAFT_6682806 [Phlegmacium glaucopus]
MESDIKQNPSNDNEVTQRRCNNCLAQGRNLVICIDGTSNQFGQRNTNVIELYNRLLKNKDQLTYYDSGIGTYAAPSSKSWNHWKQVIYNKIDVAIAWNFDEIVINAYGWLAQNYQPNDRIFLFGFSRGAYQVRTLAGMIDKVGLIHKGYERQIPFAYEIYADDHSDEALPSLRNKNMDAKPWRKFAKFFRYAVGQQSEPESPAPNRAKRFKDTFSRNIQVHFVGAWDTVSSVGIVRGKNLPGTTSADHICFFRHALALDECRVKFLPEYTYGGVAAKQVKTATMEGLEPMPRIKETWFAGTHSDIGGGNILNPNLNRCGAPLLWMSYEAISAGLLMELSNLEWKWDQLGDVHESLTGFWKIAEFLPITRLTYEDTASTTWHQLASWKEP